MSKGCRRVDVARLEDVRCFASAIRGHFQSADGPSTISARASANKLSLPPVPLLLVGNDNGEGEDDVTWARLSLVGGTGAEERADASLESFEISRAHAAWSVELAGNASVKWAVVGEGRWEGTTERDPCDDERSSAPSSSHCKTAGADARTL